MRKSIQNAIAERYTFDTVQKVSGRYIGHFKMKNGYGGGYSVHNVDMGHIDEYTKEKNSSGGVTVKRNDEKVFSFGP